MMEGSYLINGKRFTTNFKVGDRVKVAKNVYTSNSKLFLGNILTVIKTDYFLDKWGGKVYEYRPMKENHEKYVEHYVQGLRFEDLDLKFYNARNFERVEEMGNLSIGVDRPCVVWLLNENVDDAGKVTYNRVGDPVFFDNYSSAQAWTKKAIQDKIRSDNIYLKYSIMEEKSVAQASEPPVVFE